MFGRAACKNISIHDKEITAYLMMLFQHGSEEIKLGVCCDNKFIIEYPLTLVPKYLTLFAESDGSIPSSYPLTGI
jgi:hypothetical protein